MDINIQHNTHDGIINKIFGNINIIFTYIDLIPFN